MSNGSAVNLPWVAFDYSEFRNVHSIMTLEQRGLHISLCTLMFAGVTVSPDRLVAAKQLGVDPRLYRRVLGELIDMGAVYEAETGIVVHLAIRARETAVNKVVAFRHRS